MMLGAGEAGEAGEVVEAVEAGRNHIIKRPRLTRLLDETSARIILLIAPAGYGKTTLAREWLADRPHGWYRGTTSSADVAALALGLAKSASTVIPGVGEEMNNYLRASTSATPSVEALSDRLVEDLADWPTGAWLAFDDYQFTCDSSEAEVFAELFLMSSEVRCLLASRTRPTWATARRLLYGEIVELGRNAMAMTGCVAYRPTREYLELPRYACSSSLEGA
jgi:LuxR family transcriptional regulator, maltose regulon positive regulatory protein